MNLDDHPYVSFYLVGCVFAFFLHLIVTAENYIVSWFFKGNILRKNLKKIQDPAGQGFKVEAGMFTLFLFISTITSWLAVLQFIFQIFWFPLKAIREALISIPEEVKMVRFPLMNNPELSRESVWAYLNALNTKGGVEPNAWVMKEGLIEIAGYYPSFKKQVALQNLGSLNVVDPEIVSNASSLIEEEERDEQEASESI